MKRRSSQKQRHQMPFTWTWATLMMTTMLSSAVPSQSQRIPQSLSTRTSEPHTVYPSCPAYIQGRYQYTPSMGPFPIPCSKNQTWSVGPPEHQGLACCSDEGRIAVQSALVGGFDITYRTDDSVANPSTIVDSQCIAYTEALRAILCDSSQYLMIHKSRNQTRLRICQSSCQAVFDACGMPGLNYPDHANYTDGTSLCQAAWGGWNTTPCEANPDQWACQQIDGLDIVSVDENLPCLSIVYPSKDTLQAYATTQRPPDLCSPNGISVLTIFIALFVTMASFGLFATLLISFYRNREVQQQEQLGCKRRRRTGKILS